MANNQRKVYGETEADSEPAACPNCGCRHRIIRRAEAGNDFVRIVSVCRNCGHETLSKVAVR